MVKYSLCAQQYSRKRKFFTSYTAEYHTAVEQLQHVTEKGNTAVKSTPHDTHT